MKCVFCLDVDVDPSTLDERHTAKIKFRKALVGCERQQVPYFPAGTEYEHPNAAFFVRNGLADPGDDECRDAADLTPEQMAHVKHRYRRLKAGINEEDHELFDLGVITGYQTDGSYKHGPNWDSYYATKAEENAAETEI